MKVILLLVFIPVAVLDYKCVLQYVTFLAVKKRGIRTTAIITEVKRKRSFDEHGIMHEDYQYKVEYDTDRGCFNEWAVNVTPDFFSDGTTIYVSYDSKNPQRCMITGGSDERLMVYHLWFSIVITVIAFFSIINNIN